MEKNLDYKVLYLSESEVTKGLTNDLNVTLSDNNILRDKFNSQVDATNILHINLQESERIIMQMEEDFKELTKDILIEERFLKLCDLVLNSSTWVEAKKLIQKLKEKRATI